MLPTLMLRKILQAEFIYQENIMKHKRTLTFMAFWMPATLIAGTFFSTTVSASTDSACRTATDAEITELFNVWNEALRSGDPEKVASLYRDDAVLLPTLSSIVRADRAGRIDYFRTFQQKKPEGRIDTQKVFMGCNTAVAVGTYTFTFDDGSSAPARYTYTWQWSDDKWLISSHHSSRLPEAG